jgi:hypothetical protein
MDSGVVSVAEERQFLERLSVVETKLDILINSVSKLESADSKATESLLISQSNRDRIKDLEDNRKQDLRLLWGTILAGVVTGIISILVNVLSK